MIFQAAGKLHTVCRCWRHETHHNRDILHELNFPNQIHNSTSESPQVLWQKFIRQTLFYKQDTISNYWGRVGATWEVIEMVMIQQQFPQLWLSQTLDSFLGRSQVGCSSLSPWRVGCGGACSRAFLHGQCSWMGLWCNLHGCIWSSFYGMQSH